MKLDLEKTHLMSAEMTKKKNDLNDASNNNDHGPIPAQEEETAGPKFFGVRNYLHNFYEAVALKNPQLYEDIPESPPSSPKARRGGWRSWLAAAFAVLSAGLLLLVVGFVVPLRPSVAEQTGEFLVIDRAATAFNDAMRACRLAGVALFVFGFALFLAVVLGTLCWNLSRDAPPDDEEDPFLAVLSGDPRSIPATEELAAVQPKRDAAQGVATKDGLAVQPQAAAK